MTLKKNYCLAIYDMCSDLTSSYQAHVQKSRKELSTLLCGNTSHSSRSPTFLDVSHVGDLNTGASSLQDGRESLTKLLSNSQEHLVGEGSSEIDWTPTDRQRKDLMLAYDMSGT